MSDDDEQDLPVGEIVRRVAFDIGSNATKCQVADVDLSTGCISETFFQTEVPCSYGVDWKQSKDGSLSARMQLRGLEVLHTLCRKAVELGATRSAAIATEVFRKASNGEAYLSRIKDEVGLEATIVAQSMEARLGFLSAAGLSGLPRAELICWDCGGASFQVSRAAALDASELELFMGPLGVSVVTSACVEKVQKRAFATTPTPNPVSAEEVAALVAWVLSELPPPPPWLLGSEKVVAIGGANSIFCLATEIVAEVTGSTSSSITSAQARQALDAVIGRTEADLCAAYCSKDLADPASFVVPKMALLHAVMEHCELPRISFQPATGSCAGMLVASELYSS